MEETVLFMSDNMRCWNSSSPGLWKWGTYLGRIMITNQRFIFLSSGSSKMGAILATNLIAGGLLGPLIVGKSLTRDLELEALNNEGSFAVPFKDIKDIFAKRRWDLAAYLSISYADHSYAFMQDPFGMNLKVMRTIEETVYNAKTELKNI